MTATTDDQRRIDTHTEQFLDDPNAVLGRGAGRIAWAQGRTGIEFFRYETVRSMYHSTLLTPRTPGYFIDKGVTEGPVFDYLTEGNLNLMWPESHKRLRPILTRGFKPARIEQARPMMAELAERLVDELASEGSCNLVTAFSHKLSIGVIAGFIGIPYESVGAFDTATVKLRLLGQVPIDPGLPVLAEALGTVRDFSEQLVRERRADPRDDYISDLVAAEEDGAAISSAEVAWNIGGILLAGHDTTRYQFASLVRGLVDSDQWDAIVADPGLIPAAIDESLRMYPATPRQVKLVRGPITLDGLDFEAGDAVTLNVTGAGRDPDVFADPDRFDLHREPPRFDIGFGHGAHYCLGFAVARAEMEEGLAVLARRWRDVRLDGPVETAPGGTIAGPEVVPVTYRTVA